MAQGHNAFVLRIAPSRVPRMEEALKDDQLIIGWSRAPELLDPELEFEAFREILSEIYYADEDTYRRAGSAAGHMWRFLREMSPGDLVVCPYGPDFYVAEVGGEATHDPALVEDDTAFRRKARWLNDKKRISRSLARTALQSRMKARGTCAYATELLDEIRECLELAGRDKTRSFEGDLKRRLAEQALDEMRSGRIDNFGFERLVNALLEGLGAAESHIVPRALDKGADILATFRFAGAFQFLVAVQVKHYQPDPPVGADTVQQLIDGIEAEGANLGMVVTSGSFANEAIDAADAYFEDKGIRIELVDGPQLAALIVEHGLRLF